MWKTGSAIIDINKIFLINLVHIYKFESVFSFISLFVSNL